MPSFGSGISIQLCALSYNRIPLMRSSSFLLALSALSLHAFAASRIAESPAFSVPASDLVKEAASSLDKSADVTVLLDEYHWTYRIDGSARVVFRTVYQVRTADAISAWSSIEQRWEPWHEKRPVLHARVVTPDGVAHELDQKTIVDGPAGSNEQDTFSDVRLVKSPLPAVQPGSIVEEVIEQDYEPILHADVNRVFMGRPVPVRMSRLMVDYPATLPFRYTASLLDGAKATRTSESGVVHLAIEQSPMEVPDEPLPMLPFDAQRWPNVTFSTGASWQSLAREYNGIVEQRIVDAPIKDAVSGAQSITDRTARIRALVRALHEQVRYTGVEFGDAAIVPAKPVDTLKRKYGDCKDKAALLVAMLRASGIPAQLALLSAGEGLDVDPKYPGSGLFNHAIVYIPGPPEAWIDATADTLQFGSLPSADQGRLALVIGNDTTELKRIPEADSKGNVTRETREFFLPEWGKSRVVETTQGEGNADASLRANFGFAERTDMAKNLRNYMRATYVSEADIKIEHSKRDDFDHPFRLKVEIAEARRGEVTEQNAIVYIPIDQLFNDLPAYFKMEDEKDPDPKEAKRRANRKADFVLPEAFVHEWHYEIHLPQGQQVKKLPGDEKLQLGAATYSASFHVSDRTAYADFRFDTGKRVYTVQEAEDLRKGLVALLKAPVRDLSFEPKGQALLEAGKIKEAIAEFRSMVNQHPKAPVYRVQLSLALLAAGCGEQARAEALKATDLDGSSVLAWRNLGFIRLNDLIGRPFAPGWDASGAEAALRKALELDSKDFLVRRNLSLVLEYSPDGHRYVEKQRVAKAVEVLKGMKDDELLQQGLMQNMLFDLLYSEQYKDLYGKLDQLQVDAGTLGLRVAATTLTKGARAGIEEASTRASVEDLRRGALASAGQIMNRLGRYAECGDLLEAAMAGTPNAQQSAAQVAIFRRLQRVDYNSFKPDTPEHAVIYFSMSLAYDHLVPEDLYAPEALALGSKQDWIRKLRAESNGTKLAALKNQIPASNFADAASLASFSSDMIGDGGARVRVLGPNRREAFYVVPGKGRFLVLADSTSTAPIGAHVLLDIDKGDLASARQWLNWARDSSQIAGGDDSLAGPVFPRIWNKSSPADPALMRLAAATLMLNSSAIPILEKAVASTTDTAQKDFVRLAFTTACLSDHNAAKAEDAAKTLAANHEDSDTATLLLARVYRAEKKPEAATALLQQRLKKDPDNAAISRELALTLARTEEAAQAAAMELKVARSDRGTPNDWNLYLWYTLVAGKTSPEVIENANSVLTEQQTFPHILHTIASFYAEMNDATNARQILNKTMDAWGLTEPNSECWYVLGRIAEDYGVNDAALSYYAKVEAPAAGAEDPVGTFVLAQRRIAALKGQAVAKQSAAGAGGAGVQTRTSLAKSQAPNGH